MGPDDRAEVLGATSAEALFGDAVHDPGRLRKAYASLAKRWRDDAEVTAHVRRLFEAARDGAPLPPPTGQASQPEPEPPPSPAQALAAARASGNLQRVFDCVAAHAAALVATAPDELESAVRDLLIYGGTGLSREVLDLLEAVVRTPAWVLHPDIADQFLIQLSQLRALQDAAADPDVPPALLAAVRALWAEPGHRVAELWVGFEESLRDVPLDSALAHLEAAHPSLLGQLALADLRMLLLAEQAPVELPADELATLRRRYRPTCRGPLAPADAWTATLDQDVSWRFAVTLAFFVPLSLVLNPIGAMAVAYALRVLTMRSVLAVTRNRDLFLRLDSAQGQPLEPLLEFARRHALHPRELAARLHEPVPFALTEAFAEGHPVLRLDSRVGFDALTPAFVSRLRTIAESAHAR